MTILLQNIVTMIGLGIGIDYCLLMVGRFREEIVSNPDPETAAINTLRTAGHTIVLSGSAVAIGFAALLLVPATELRSIATGGLRDDALARASHVVGFPGRGWPIMATTRCIIAFSPVAGMGPLGYGTPFNSPCSLRIAARCACIASQTYQYRYSDRDLVARANGINAGSRGVATHGQSRNCADDSGDR